MPVPERRESQRNALSRSRWAKIKILDWAPLRKSHVYKPCGRPPEEKKTRPKWRNKTS